MEEMKSKLVLKTTDSLWALVKSRAAAENKLINVMVNDLIKQALGVEPVNGGSLNENNNRKGNGKSA